MNKSHITMLFAILIVCFFAQLSGYWLTHSTVLTWYPTLIKPPFNPPNFVFGPVWTILYILIALSLWIFWKTPSAYSKTSGYIFWWLQLFCNFIWSGLFFYLKSPFLALIDIVILFLFILCTMITFYRVKPLSALLLIPYLIWVTFATYLNVSIWYLNR